MNILGISAFYHDSAAAIVCKDDVVAVAQEERLARKKNMEDFPVYTIRYCLEEAGLSLEQLDAVVFYDKPLLKFERLLETYYNEAPSGLVSFLNAMPVWVREKLFLRRLIGKELKRADPGAGKLPPLLFTEHHLSHAASAFFPSPFEESAILTIDGVGEWATSSIGIGRGNHIEFIRELHYPHSVGLLYSAFTYFLGFRVNHGEYKMMGLAPYGNAKSADYQRYRDVILSTLIDLKDDGSIALNQEYFAYSTSMRMVPDHKWHKLLGLPRRDAADPIDHRHCDLALAIQHVTEDIVLKMAWTAKTLTGSRNLCLAGGVALNCVANGKLHQQGWFDQIFIQPAAGDAGGALGAALAANYINFDRSRQVLSPDAMHNSYLGPEYDPMHYHRIFKRYDADKTLFETDEALCTAISEAILNGKVIGWFQDRMEYGPRALGNRSILGNPLMHDMQRVLNLKIKYRESFRPFAPIMLEEEAERLFEFKGTSPYMLMVANVREEFRNPLPADYKKLGAKEQLAMPVSKLPAVSHVDFSSRLQTISAASNPLLHRLVSKFRDATGFGMLINTSFNVKDEPVVCTPEDAFYCFMNTEMDILVLGRHVFYKSPAAAQQASASQ